MIMKAKELKKETIQELHSKLDDLRKKHMEMRFEHASGTLKNPVQMRIVKRDIARISTIIKEKENE